MRSEREWGLPNGARLLLREQEGWTRWQYLFEEPNGTVVSSYASDIPAHLAKLLRDLAEDNSR